MIAAHYPPMKGSSGLQRSLKFSEYLPDYDWSPIVLTVNKRVHMSISDEQLGEIPKSVITKSAFALDAKRHLSVHGVYPKWLSLPDRWSSWWVGAVPAGRKLIRKYRPQVIWSTYPIATAHLIGYSLSKWSGIPWIADMRDSMTEDDYPEDPQIRRSVLAVERKTVNNAQRCVFTAPSAQKMYAERYPSIPNDRWSVISNGFDEANFSQSADVEIAANEKAITLVHSGLLDPADRDPTKFFNAISTLKKGGEISAAEVEIRLRATGFDELYERELRDRGIDDIVRLCAPVGYKEALSEMMAADGLILFQGEGCNHQIPAKAYEYFRAGRPVLGLVSPHGDTGSLLKGVGIKSIAALEREQDMVSTIAGFVAEVRQQRAYCVPRTMADNFSRRALTGQLANLCESLECNSK